MRLYVVECNCFKTKEELMDYCQKKNIPFDDTYILDYLGNVAGRSDVIRKIDYNGQSHLYTAIDTDGYAIYNEARSTYRGEFVWEYEYGDIRSFYNSFRSRGIRFSHDVYGKIDEGYQKLLRMIKK